MLPKILIIIGILLILGGLIGLLSIYVQPIMKAFRVVYEQDRDDFWYEHGNGRQAQREGRRLLTGMYTIVVVIGVILTGAGLVMEYMPRGNDSIFSEEVAGATTGDDAEFDDGTEDMNAGFLNTPGEYCVVVSGNVIRLNGRAFNSVEEFEAVIKELDRTKEVSVTDDFAVSATYHQVMDLINRYGLVCGEKTE